MQPTSTLSSSLTLQIHSSKPNVQKKNHPHAPKLRKSPSVHFPTSRPRRKTKPFSEEDAFPSSLPLHTKNPHAIYNDIESFARQNKLKEALTILDYMDQQGIPINLTTFSSLIAACVRTKSLSEGKQIHTHMIINGFETNEFLNTKLVNMYMACGSTEDAKRVFSSSPTKSVYPYNAMIRGTVISGGRRYLDAISTFSDMRELGVECNEYTFSCMIKSFAGASALKQGLKTHALMVKNGFIDSLVLRTSLIDMYFKCGKVKLACLIFEEIEEKDIVVWGAMIAGFAHNRLYREALEFIRRMIAEGVYPNSVILTSILPVIGMLQCRRLGQELHGYVMKTKSYSKQLFIQSSLIDMYCKCGDMFYGRQVFYFSLERNAVSWTALMSGYVSNGRLQQALRSVVWMQQEGFMPDVVTIATILPVCSELKDLKHGEEIHAYAVKNNFLPNVSLSTSLMVMYSKCGVFSYSLRVFEEMPRRNVKSWTAMIDAYAESGFLCEALGVFRSMQLSKHRPDSVTISRSLNICSELKALKLGKEIHAHVLKKNLEKVPFVSSGIVKMYGCCQEIWRAKSVFDCVSNKGSLTWTAVIEAYGLCSMYRDAISHFDEMMSQGVSPNRFTFNVVLGICDRAGFVDEAQRVFNLMPLEYKVDAYRESSRNDVSSEDVVASKYLGV